MRGGRHTCFTLALALGIGCTNGGPSSRDGAVSGDAVTSLDGPGNLEDGPADTRRADAIAAPIDAGVDASASGTPGTLRDYLGDPSFPDDFWKPAPAGGLDQATMERAVAQIAAKRWEIHAFLVAREGRVLFERYGWNSGANSFDPNKQPRQVLPSERHLTFSTTKSFLSALVGIALGEGAIPGLKAKAAASFPDYASLNPSAEKAAITLEDLLTMRSGLQFTEGEQVTFAAADPARAMFSRPVVDLPVGTVWNYSTGGSDVVAEILRVATQTAPLPYAKAKLFAPMGIVDPPWTATASGSNYGGFGLELTAREMARFGELLRNRGVWAGKQLVPSAWIETATTAKCASTWGLPYGYHFWIFGTPGFVGTIGAFGQQIFVNREKGLVVVFTANLPSEDANVIFEGLLRDYVVPALR